MVVVAVHGLSLKGDELDDTVLAVTSEFLVVEDITVAEGDTLDVGTEAKLGEGIEREIGPAKEVDAKISKNRKRVNCMLLLVYVARLDQEIEVDRHSTR